MSRREREKLAERIAQYQAIADSAVCAAANIRQHLIDGTKLWDGKPLYDKRDLRNAEEEAIVFGRLAEVYRARLEAAS